MARLEDKIAEIADTPLRQAIAEEVTKLKKRTRFGLVFEEHQPEVVPVHGARIKRGERVAKKTGSLAEVWRVLEIADGQALCEKEKVKAGKPDEVGEHETFAVEQLVIVRRMGEAIYPALTPMNAISNGDPAQPHHVLIEADNYHALQLLLFPYENKVDCIYIDPPYNTGARDWKYNNDYVDGNDAWQHSKWLTFMAKRLRLAKRLLNPETGVLIVTTSTRFITLAACWSRNSRMPMCRWQLSSSTRKALRKAVCRVPRNMRCSSLCRRPTFRQRPTTFSRLTELTASASSSRAGSGYCEAAPIPAEQTGLACFSPFMLIPRPARLSASASRYRFPERRIRRPSITRLLGRSGRMALWEIGASARQR